MSSYDITVVKFVGPRDSFFFTFRPGIDDEAAIAKIVDRWREEGYKPVRDSVERKWKVVDGELQERDHERGWRPAAYKRISAFLRA